MPSIKLGLAIIASLIVLSLAFYALYLHFQVKTLQKIAQQNDEEERLIAQENLTKRNNNIIKDIRFIAQALVTEQCELTEGVLRIHHLADAIDSDLMLQQEFTAIHQHFIACKGMAIKDAYKELTKKQRFQQDQQRFRLEQTCNDDVMNEAKLLIQYAFDNLKNLH
jgi:Ca2+/H+ antiporter